MRVAYTIYYIATVFLVLLLGVIIVKLMFWSPCTPNGTKDATCIVDGWSVGHRLT